MAQCSSNELLSSHGFLVYSRSMDMPCAGGIATFSSLVNSLKVAAQAHIGVGHRGFWSREENPNIEHLPFYFLFTGLKREADIMGKQEDRGRKFIYGVLAKLADARRPSLRTRSGGWPSRPESVE